MDEKFSRLGFVRSSLVPALLLFAIPAIGYSFAQHAQSSYDARFLTGVSEAIQSDQALSADKRAELLQFYREHPASQLCRATDESRAMLSAQYAADVCGTHNQFHYIRQVSLASAGLGLLSLLVAAGCVALSFASREMLYWSFVAGWNFLRVSSALQVLAQGFLAVMLSFWLTAFFWERYFVKLILVAAVAAGAAALMLIRAIFTRSDDKLTVEGEPLSRERSPALWSRVEALCAKLGTAPPQAILGGIDDNFFVTEHPVHAGDRVFAGRSLFVSLSLLKRLTKPEADAVLAHEMAHFSGGDTLFSKKLAPLLSRYVVYMQALYSSGLSRPIFYFMLFYWSMFQLSLSRVRRERELRADRLSAEATSADSMANALLKVAAYSRYRARVEQGLFERNRAHSGLDIAHSVAVGFTEYARGTTLTSDLEAEGSVPHPFDSHPSLTERFENVGLRLEGEALVERVLSTDVQTWFNEIGDAQQIEDKLWKDYEARFLSAHEEALAYRYLPANDNERAHVERFFPAVTIAGKEHEVSLDCERLHYGGWSSPLPWATIKEMAVKEKTFRGKVIAVSFEQDGSKQTCELPLSKLSVQEAEVLAVISRYYTRALAAQQHNAELPKSA